jgi:repressor LexA
MSSLMPQQVNCLNAIKRLSARGVSPTMREIGTALGVRSTSTVARLVNGLEERGAVRRMPFKQRGLVIIDDTKDQTDVLSFMLPETRKRVRHYAQRHSMTAEKAVAEICQRYLAGRVAG